jgi:8-oxo-dGTP pyrophosphatase MutT (NUDIX family)
MTGYMAEMRKLVGHRTIIQCAASIICVDEKGRLLLGKRSDNHKLGYSGGAIEVDEYVEDCAKRELFEEMGLIAEELEFFCVNSGPEAHYIYPNGDEVSNYEIVYLCHSYTGEARNNDGEMEELCFFAPEDIDIDLISPPIRPVLRRYLEQYA